MIGPHRYDPEHCPECQIEDEQYPIESGPGSRIPLGVLISGDPFKEANIRPTQIQHRRDASTT